MQARIPRKINSLNEILDKYRYFFFDMDGVLVFSLPFVFI